MIRKYSTSKQLIKNTKNFLEIKHYSFFDRIFSKKGVFYGWGRKRSGLKVVELDKKLETSYVLLEDGFIRSLGLGIDGSPSFSLVEDDLGIYYDATVPSRLENILSTYDFTSDVKLMEDAHRAMGLMVEYNISKYNDAPLVDSRFPIELGMTEGSSPRMTGNLGDELDPRVKPEDDEEGHRNDGKVILNSIGDLDDNILIIAQTAGDASLEYGMLDDYTTQDMINAALEENSQATVYLKIHPDVLSGKKKSDVDVDTLDSRVHVITQNVNPISLLKHFTKVYTKTSGMGFEALLVGCECVCFGMPFYAGWGITDDRCRDSRFHGNDEEGHGDDVNRRGRKLSVEEVFAGAYILYTRYHNPYTNKPSDIFDTIETIVKMKSVV